VDVRDNSKIIRATTLLFRIYSILVKLATYYSQNYAGTLGTALTLKNRADNVVNNMSDAMSLPLILLHDTPSFVMHSGVQIPSKYTLHEIFCIM